MAAYDLIYSGNSNTGGTAPATASHEEGSTVVLATNSGTLVKTGKVFMGWNTQADGLGTTYAAGANYTMPALETTLYALWGNVVTFNVDGGSSVSSQNVAPGGKATEPTAPTKTGLAFLGWHTTSGLTVSFDFDTVISAATTIYAKWGDPIANLVSSASNGVSFGATYVVTAANDTANETVFSIDFNAGYDLAFGVLATKADGTVVTPAKISVDVDVVTITFTISPVAGDLIHVIAQRVKMN